MLNCKLSVGRYLALFVFAAIIGCSSSDRPQVVVYTALDEMYSRPILDRFEAEHGIDVRVQYDTEASKTTGLVNRIIAERDRPRADVFWNNEVAQTIVLKRENLLATYTSPNAEAMPENFKDIDGYWTGFAARGRVIVFNPEVVNAPPQSILDFTKPEWKGKLAIANPLFGTTATHAAALFAAWGEEAAHEFFMAMRENEVAILPGNATVRDLVAQGEYVAGLTDTDDANSGIEARMEIDWLFPDQGPNGLGTLIIPNTVALIRGAPNPDGGKRLIDYLLTAEVEKALSELPSVQIPLNPAVNARDKVPRLENVRTMDVSFAAIAKNMERAATFIRDDFLP